MPIEDWDPELTSDHLTGFVCSDASFRSDWQYAFSDHPQLGQLLYDEIKVLMASLEGLLPSGGAGVHSQLLQRWPDRWKWMVDWWYSKELVERIPSLVDRFMKLSPVLIEGRVPAPRINVYLREATRCYLYGLSSASRALSRAAVEAGLDEHLRRRLGHAPNLDLAEKINQATRFNLISKETAFLADSVRNGANKVLHEEPCSDQEAFDTLVQARRVIAELYG